MKKRKTHQKEQFWLIGCLDFAALLLSTTGAILITRALHTLPPYSTRSLLMFYTAAILSFCAAFYCFYKPSDPYPRLRPKQVIHVLLCNISLITGIAVLLQLTKSALLQMHTLLFFFYILNSLLDCLCAFTVRRQAFYRLQKSKNAKQAVVLSSAETVSAVIQALEESVWINICGVFLTGAQKAKTPCHPALDSRYKICGNENDLVQWVRSQAVDAVYIVLPPGSLSKKQAAVLVEELVCMGVHVHISTHLTDESKAQTHDTNLHFSQRIAAFAAVRHKPAHLIFKRVLDVVFGLLGSLAAIPIIAIAAIPLKLESKGPLFFTQTRVGKNGRTFKIYKLRTMYADAEAKKAELLAHNEMQGHMFKMENDPRITKVGRFLRKTSLDELPQFFNILKGDMSLVGTRPPTMDEFIQYESHHKRRLSMPAGLTGMWQTSGRSDITDFEEVVRLDLQYIDNWSVALDLQLMLKTIAVLFKRQGAK